MSNLQTKGEPVKRRCLGAGQESGQGTVEYILVLIIVVIITLGLVYQFNRAFRTYADGYFGDYIACLLESGELPGSVNCTADAPAFNLSAEKQLVVGQMPTGSPGGGGSGGSNGSKSDTNGNSSGSDASKDASSTSDKGKTSDNGDAGGSHSEVASTSSSPATVGNISDGFGSSRHAQSTAVGTIDPKDQSSLGGPDSLLGVSPTSRVVGRFGGPDKSRVNNLSWGYAGEDEEKQKADEKPTFAKTNAKVDESGDKLRPKKVIINLTRTIASQQEQDDSAFTFSGLLKWILIIVMILAIVVFFGGQLLQISKSGEK